MDSNFEGIIKGLENIVKLNLNDEMQEKIILEITKIEGSSSNDNMSK